MKDLLIVDLKNTLVASSGTLRREARELVELEMPRNIVCLLYSVNESWTYQTLCNEDSIAELFDSVLLVRKKQQSDIEALTNRYDRILVIGDSKEEELLFATKLKLDFLDAANGFPIQEAKKWLLGGKNNE